MSNQNNRLQQNQQAASQSAAAQAAVGGAPQFMHPMVMPGMGSTDIFLILIVVLSGCRPYIPDKRLQSRFLSTSLLDGS